jgi:hypothetical protein
MLEVRPKERNGLHEVPFRAQIDEKRAYTFPACEFQHPLERYVYIATPSSSCIAGIPVTKSAAHDLHVVPVTGALFADWTG